MPVFEGTYRPPAATLTWSVVAIGGMGRCEITGEGMIFEGLKSSPSLRTIALALAAGALAALSAIFLDELGVINLDPALIVGEAICAMLGVGLICRQRADKNRPVRYEVKLGGIRQVRRAAGEPSTLLIEAPGIRDKAAIFFRPAEGAEAFLEAYRQVQPGT